MFGRTRLGLERLEDRDAPSGIEPIDPNGPPPLPPSDPPPAQTGDPAPPVGSGGPF